MGYRRVCGGFRRMPKPPQISAVTHQISLVTIKFLRFPGWLAIAKLVGNTGTQNFDVFPSRLCAHQISERLQGRWLNIIKSDIMVDPNKIRLDSVKDSVVVSTARKYVSKVRNFREFWMNFDNLWKLIRIYASWLIAVRSPWAHWYMLSFCTTSVIIAILKIGNILAAALWTIWKAMTILKSFTRNLKKCTPRFVILIDVKHFFFHFWLKAEILPS